MSEPTASPMMIRLANVICWGCTGLSVMFLLLLAHLVFISNVLYDPNDNISLIIMAVASYAFGRGVRYVIAGR